MFISWKDRITALGARKRYALAFALGLLAVLALPPLYVVPLLIPAFVGLAWLLDAARTRRAAFFTGWWFGWGFFIAGLYWMSYSFLVDAAAFAWLIPFAVPGLSAVAAIYIGLATLSAHWLAPAGVRRVALLPAAWVVFEYLRGILLTGFPWNLIGSVWAFHAPMLQGLALFGAYGLSLVTVAAAVAPAALADATAAKSAKWSMVGLSLALLTVVWVGGAVRLADAPLDTVPGVRLRLIQPDVAQSLKWQPELRAEIMQRLLSMSAEPSEDPRPTHIIWPETAVPVFLEHSPNDLAAVGRITPPGGALITGAARIRRSGDRESDVQLWNSIHVIDAEGRIRASYDKFHLVPFGEYMPLPAFLGRLALAAERVDFSPGPGPVTLAIAGAPPASPLVCYEAIFPAHVTAPWEDGAVRPQWLLNVTNDAWFGISSGPYQHLASARMRALEEGIPLVRAANNGVSGVYDAYGRVRAEAGLGRRAIVDADLPTPTPAVTFYSRYGNYTLSVVLLIYVVVFPVFPKGRIHATFRM
jgi:apolipoprotein N-acyltransferase